MEILYRREMGMLNFSILKCELHVLNDQYCLPLTASTSPFFIHVFSEDGLTDLKTHCTSCK